jgi:hypothetical protein
MRGVEPWHTMTSQMADPSEDPGPRIVLMRMDRVDSTATFLRSDGKEATLPLPSAVPEPTSAIASLTWALEPRLLFFETTTGDQIVAELASASDLAPLRGRPVVYLDQNHWSTLANTIHAPKLVGRPGELEAARHIIELARARTIILPMSAAHMSETSKWTNNDARYRLALTILQMSAGWQMRDPLDVRRFELRQALTSTFKNRRLHEPMVFTLEPDAIHGETRDSQPYEPPSDFPEEAAFAVRTLTCISGDFDTMLDAEPVAMGESPGWVETLQQFTDWLAQEPRDRYLRRQRTNLLFITDLSRELPEEALRAGITPDQMSDWTRQRSDTDFAALPSLGLFREVLREKLLNPGTRWESNDLTDIMYLTCAAGYADHVVGENSLTGQMEQGLRRLERPINVHRSLSQLAEAL